MCNETRNYAIKQHGWREFGEREPRVRVADETVADKARLTRAVHGLRTVTVIAYTQHVFTPCNGMHCVPVQLGHYVKTRRRAQNRNYVTSAYVGPR